MLTGLLGLLGALGSGLLGGVGTVAKGIGGIATGVGGPLLSLGGQALQIPGVAGLLGQLIGGKQQQQAPPLVQTVLNTLQPGQQGFLTAPKQSKIKATPQLRLALSQARTIARLQDRFVKATIEPQLKLLERSRRTDTRARIRQQRTFERAQRRVRALQARSAARGGLGRKRQRKLERLLALPAPPPPTFDPRLLTPFSMLGIRAF